MQPMIIARSSCLRMTENRLVNHIPPPKQDIPPVLLVENAEGQYEIFELIGFLSDHNDVPFEWNYMSSQMRLLTLIKASTIH